MQKKPESVGDLPLVRHAGSVISAISLIALFGSNLDLGYLAENILTNYRTVRDVIWSPLSFFFSIEPFIKDLGTFCSVFIPAFLVRGGTRNQVAALSLLGSLLLAVGLAVIVLLGSVIDNFTGLYSWIERLDDEDNVIFIFVVLISLPIIVPIYCFLVSIPLSMIFWCVCILIPHFGIYANKLIKRLDSGIFDMFVGFTLNIPYMLGAYTFQQFFKKNYENMHHLESDLSELEDMNWEELLHYYRPVCDVLIAATAILLASKVIFSTS